MYSFTGGADGSTPYANLIQASDGNLYGTTTYGGTSGNGTVFKITTGGTLTTLYRFSGIGPDGGYPQAGLIQGTDGNLYGTAQVGGITYAGTVFKITTGGTFTTLYSFTGGADGSTPYAGLVQGSDGNLYGTTYAGGAHNGNGTVFQITTGGTLTTLYSFTGNEDGGGPEAGLIQASDGNLYGTTQYGGANYGSGTVFKITTGGVLTTVYSFTGGTDGAYPYSGVIQASDGNLYGTTQAGGANFTSGAVFQIVTHLTVARLGSISPSQVAAGSSALTLTLNGTRFSRDLVAMWGTTALSTTYVSTTKLKATIPASLLTVGGNFPITVATSTAASTPALNFTVTNPTPSLTALSSYQANAGSSTLTLTLVGRNFNSSSVAMWGTTALATTFVSSTRLTATVSASLLKVGGTFSVTVANPSPGGGTSSALNFTVYAPTLLSLSISQANAGSSNISLTVSGRNFVSGSVAMWGTTALTTAYGSASTLTATIPASLLSVGGTVPITVVNPGGATSNALNFTVNVIVPTLSKLSIYQVPAGSPDTTISLYGTNFVSGSVAMWGTTALSTTYVSASTLTATIPASLLTAGGTFSITVVNPGPGTSSALNFTVLAPVLSKLSIYKVTAGSPDTTIGLYGTNFVSGSVAMWGTTALSTTYGSASTLTATIPASLLTVGGTFAITVVNPGGATSSALSFTVLAPVLSKLSIYKVPAGSPDTTISLYGTNFVSGSVAMWGTTALTTSYVSSTTLTATIPASLLKAKGIFLITVVNPGGATSNASNFTVTVYNGH